MVASLFASMKLLCSDLG